MAGDPPTRVQDVTGDCQFVGGCANISDIVVEDEIFEMDKFAVDPQRCAGVAEMGTLDPALSDRRTGDTFVQARQFDTGAECRLQQCCHADFCEIASH